MATCSSILAWKIPWRGAWQAIIHGGHKELDMTEHTHEDTHTHTHTHTQMNYQVMKRHGRDLNVYY